MAAYPPPAGDQYPPQQGYGYPPTAAYPPKVEQPPGYYDNQPYAPQQSTASNVVVVGQQPTATHTVYGTTPSGSEYYLILSVVTTVLCALCLFGGCIWGGFSLCCTIPALMLSVSANDSASRGDVGSAQSKGRISLILNIVSIVWWIVALVVAAILIGVLVSTTSSRSDCYTDYYYNYYYNEYTCRYYV